MSSNADVGGEAEESEGETPRGWPYEGWWVNLRKPNARWVILRHVREGRPSRGVDVHLDPEALHDARTVAPGWDVYMLEQEWRSWLADYAIEAPRDPAKAFVGFCRKWFATRGRPA